MFGGKQWLRFVSAGNIHEEISARAFQGECFSL